MNLFRKILDLFQRGLVDNSVVVPSVLITNARLRNAVECHGWQIRDYQGCSYYPNIKGKMVPRNRYYLYRPNLKTFSCRDFFNCRFDHFRDVTQDIMDENEVPDFSDSSTIIIHPETGEEIILKDDYISRKI